MAESEEKTYQEVLLDLLQIQCIILVGSLMYIGRILFRLMEMKVYRHMKPE